jgi:hypothetical protein
MVLEELSCVLLDDVSQSNDDLPRILRYLVGLIHQLDSLLANGQPKLPLAAPVRSQAICFRQSCGSAIDWRLDLDPE